MDKITSTYETLFIVDMTEGEETVKATVEKFVSLIEENGEILAKNEWGKRKLAYAIEDRTEGYYVLVNFSAPHDFPLELERLYNINTNILRSMVITAEAPKEGTGAAPEIAVIGDSDDDYPRRRRNRPAPVKEESAETAPVEEAAAAEVEAEAAPAEEAEAPAAE